MSGPFIFNYIACIFVSAKDSLTRIYSTQYINMHKEIKGGRLEAIPELKGRRKKEEFDIFASVFVAVVSGRRFTGRDSSDISGIYIILCAVRTHLALG